MSLAAVIDMDAGKCHFRDPLGRGGKCEMRMRMYVVGNVVAHTYCPLVLHKSNA